MNIKVIIIVVVIAGGLYQVFKPPGKMEVLMTPMEVMSESGVRHVGVTPGSDFDADDLAEPGSLTIVEFYTDACSGCRSLHQHYQRFLALRPDVAVRQIRMPDKWSVNSAMRMYGLSIGSTPHIHIYDPQGQALAKDEGRNKAGFNLLYEWMNAELRKEFRNQQSS